MFEESKYLDLIVKVAKQLQAKQNVTDEPETEGAVEVTQGTKTQDEGAEEHAPLNRNQSIDMGAEVSYSTSVDNLRSRRSKQNLKQQEDLLKRLFCLFTIQLIAMNIVVVVILVWIIFDISFFNDCNPDVFVKVCDFAKYYITTVLAELLGGIIFIVYKVFSYKD